jgi:hypothetical protein
MLFTSQDQVEKKLKESNPELLIIRLGEGTTLDKIESITKGKYSISDFNIMGEYMINDEAGIAAIYSEEMLETHSKIKQTQMLVNSLNNKESSKFIVIPKKKEDEINYLYRDNIIGNIKCNGKSFNIHKGENNTNDPTIYYVIPKEDTPKVVSTPQNKSSKSKLK